MTHETTADSSEQRRPWAATVPSRRAPDGTSPFRRSSEDPTLGDGSKAPTTVGWAPSPTLTDRRTLQTPGYVIVDDAAESSGARVAEALECLGRPVERIRASDGGGHAPGPLNHPQVVHLGAASALGEGGAQTVDRILRSYRAGATVTYDPALGEHSGSLEELKPRVERLVSRSDVVQVSAEDLARLYPGEDRQDVVRRWVTSGPGIVVVSLGKEGAWAANAVGVTATAPGTGQSADGGSAQGAFTAGLIDALWKGGLLGVAGRTDLRTLVWGSLQELVDNATAAAGVVHRSGSLPTRGELETARGVPQLTARPS